jgi:hypothetical protein
VLQRVLISLRRPTPRSPAMHAAAPFPANRGRLALRPAARLRSTAWAFQHGPRDAFMGPSHRLVISRASQAWP